MNILAPRQVRVKTPTPGTFNLQFLFEGFLVYITMNSVFHLDVCKF